MRRGHARVAARPVWERAAPGHTIDGTLPALRWVVRRASAQVPMPPRRGASCIAGTLVQLWRIFGSSGRGAETAPPPETLGAESGCRVFPGTLVSHVRTAAVSGAFVTFSVPVCFGTLFGDVGFAFALGVRVSFPCHVSVGVLWAR